MVDKKKNSKENLKYKLSVDYDKVPILFTDNINIVANENGVVFTVMQKMKLTEQIRVVARIGISRTHAKKLIESLQKILLKSELKVNTGSKMIN